MRPARLPAIRVLVVGTRCQYRWRGVDILGIPIYLGIPTYHPTPPPPGQNDRRLRKDYLPATTVKGGSNERIPLNLLGKWENDRFL